MKNIIIVSLMALGLAACESHVQTTSGKSYLEKYKDLPSVAARKRSPTAGEVAKEQADPTFQETLVKAASVEPILKFPARIGLARIDQGRLTGVPGAEAEAWLKVRKNLGRDFGEFVPLSPMVAHMASRGTGRNVNDTMEKIRLGAARQHMDAVLVYEVYSKAHTERTLLAFTDVTLIGAFIFPNRSVEAKGFANAMLIDVFQGYPYGTANVTLDDESLSTSFGSDENERELAESVKIKAGVKLTGEVEKMFERLYRKFRK